MVALGPPLLEPQSRSRHFVCLPHSQSQIHELCGWAAAGKSGGFKPCAQGGVWVLGMIKGGAADRAGVRQGDELLSIDGNSVAALSPFQAAGLLQGTDETAPPSVSLEVCTLPEE